MSRKPTRTPRPLDRRAAVGRLLRDRADLLVVSGLGAPTYDVAAAGDRERNFYLWGAMGGAAMVGLGLALAQPDTPVCVITGDGEMLMGLGSFATIALQRPKNLSVVVLDNGLYGETGGQQTHTALSHDAVRTDLAAVASACGIGETLTVEAEDQLNLLAGRINRLGEGPLLAVIRIDGKEYPRVLPSRDGVAIKARFRTALGLPSM